MVIKLIERPKAPQIVSYGEFGKIAFNIAGESEVSDELGEQILNSKYHTQFEQLAHPSQVFENIEEAKLPEEEQAPKVNEEKSAEPEIDSVEEKEEEPEFDLKHLTLKQLKEAAKEAKLPEEEYISIATKKEMVDYLSPKLNG